MIYLWVTYIDTNPNYNKTYAASTLKQIGEICPQLLSRAHANKHLWVWETMFSDSSAAPDVANVP